MQEETFSIVIPSFNGAKKLPLLLASILSQKFYSFKITIVLDGSTDNSEEYLNKYKDPRLSFIVQENQGRAKARNNGTKVSKGNIVFFLDDDMRLSDDILMKHLIHHQNNPNSILVGKVVVDDNLTSKDFDKYLSHLFLKWDVNYVGKTRISEKNLKFTTQHLSMPRIIFEQLHGFDERLTDAEDYDFAMRALKKGFSIYYDPSLVAYHDDFPKCKKYIKRQVEYKKAHQYLTQIGVDYDNTVFPAIAKPKGLRLSVVEIFKREKWVNWVDRGFFVFLPKKIRYKLYAEIIYAHTVKGLKLLS